MPSAGLPQEATVGPHMPSSSQIQWAFSAEKVKSQTGSRDWNVSMVDIHLRKLLWMYCSGHAGVNGNDWTNGGQRNPHRNFRHYLLAQNQGLHTIDRLDDLPREGHRQSDEHWNCFKGNVSETELSAYGLFRLHGYHLELNWTCVYVSGK